MSNLTRYDCDDTSWGGCQGMQSRSDGSYVKFDEIMENIAIARDEIRCAITEAFNTLHDGDESRALKVLAELDRKLSLSVNV